MFEVPILVKRDRKKNFQLDHIAQWRYIQRPLFEVSLNIPYQKQRHVIFQYSVWKNEAHENVEILYIAVFCTSLLSNY